jgi:hypothetical protein
MSTLYIVDPVSWVMLYRIWAVDVMDFMSSGAFIR